MLTTSIKSATPYWHSPALKIAALCNVCCGVFAVLFPIAIFQFQGVDPLPNYPELWQCYGMMVGVCGIGFWCASADSVRHWPIVLVGFLSKILGPICFVLAVFLGRFPWLMGVTILANDLIWWIPFASILLHARCSCLSSETPNQFGHASTRTRGASRRRGTSPVVQITIRDSLDARTITKTLLAQK